MSCSRLIWYVFCLRSGIGHSSKEFWFLPVENGIIIQSPQSRCHGYWAPLFSTLKIHLNHNHHYQQPHRTLKPPLPVTLCVSTEDPCSRSIHPPASVTATVWFFSNLLVLPACHLLQGVLLRKAFRGPFAFQSFTILSLFICLKPKTRG